MFFTVLIIILAIIGIINIFKDPSEFSYEYDAATIYPDKNHSYSFNVKKESDGFYRCYIISVPDYRGHDTSNYTPHVWCCGTKRWICWTGDIKYPEQAKTLCRKWADATQVFIDTGVPLPAFQCNNYL